MAIASTDIVWKYSNPNLTQGNSGSGTAATSLGGQMSGSEWAGGSLNDLFPDITGAENAASNADYRCVFIHNKHATLTYLGAKVYISAEVGGGASIAIGKDVTYNTPIACNHIGHQAAEISTKDTDPGVTFYTYPISTATALSLGDIAPGYCIALWIKRTAANTPAMNGDGATLTVFGDTMA